MESGDVRFGPDTLVSWASFTGENTTITCTSSPWYVWLVIDVASESVTWNEGAAVTALDSTEKLTKINVPLVKITLTDGVITEIKHLYCGDVLISRAAG
jgi:hypothetical protein